MRVINANNVNDAYVTGVQLLRVEGEPQSSRAGKVLVFPEPVTTVYHLPQERVLFDPTRDANPFFSIFESLWMLAGRNDATWLDRFVSDFSVRFAEKDGSMHGAYGFRWRNHFDMEGGGHPNLPDQLDTIVRLLRKDPTDRRVVLQMWDPVADLGAQKRDVPCNTQAYLRVVSGEMEYLGPKLDMTVCCRSNDIIWGAYGANAVHFSVLLEYLARRIGVRIGTYTQISNNYHAYLGVLERIGEPTPPPNPYPSATPMGNDWDKWDVDLKLFMAWAASPAPEDVTEVYANTWFAETAEPLYLAHHMWRAGHREEAHSFLKSDAYAISPDWKRAGLEWMERRLARSMTRKQENTNAGQ